MDTKLKFSHLPFSAEGFTINPHDWSSFIRASRSLLGNLLRVGLYEKWENVILVDWKRFGSYSQKVQVNNKCPNYHKVMTDRHLQSFFQGCIHIQNFEGRGAMDHFPLPWFCQVKWWNQRAYLTNFYNLK